MVDYAPILPNLDNFWAECAAVSGSRSAVEETAVYEKLWAKVGSLLSLDEVYKFYRTEVDQLRNA